MAKKKGGRLPENGSDTTPVMIAIQNERQQAHATRQRLFEQLERVFRRPVVSFFTSFRYPVMLEDNDADMLEATLRTMDLTNGLVLMISSPGGDGLAAERIVNILRTHSGAGEYWALVPGKAKSAATMVCFGASRIYMGPSSELGPVDPQLITSQGGVRKQFSIHNIVNSYEELFMKAVNEKGGNLEPYLQQLDRYDNKEIQEFKAAIDLANDISIRTLKSGMMKRFSEDTIRQKIEGFLSPKRTKSHGRPIFREEAAACELNVYKIDKGDENWGHAYDLYMRSDQLVSTFASKCIEGKEFSFVVPAK